MYIPDDILNSVAFLSPDDYEARNLGTGFTVGIRGDVGNIVLYLVTAAQVARQIDGVPFLIGLNFRALQFGKSIIRTRDNYRWWYHPSEAETVDVTVTMFAVQGTHLNFDYIPVSMLASDNLISTTPVSSGCSVDTIRLEAKLTGQERQLALPIHGCIASSATEDVDSYEIETESDPGMPGTPVFVHHGSALNPPPVADARRRPELTAMSLLGLLSETNRERSKRENKSGSDPAGRIASLVVPAKRILEVLNHPELMAKRDRLDQDFKEMKGRWMTPIFPSR